jgi:peptidyl-prolyl cis-trans isomerase C
MFSHPRYILLRLALLLALGLSRTPVPPTPTPPPLAAIVNGEWITEAEFQAEVDRYRAAQESLGNGANADDAADQVVLDDLIAQVLLSQAAHADGFEITEADLQSRLDALASDAGGVDALATWQSEHGYTADSFQSALKRAAEAAWMRDKIISAVPGTADQVHARQILLYNEDTARKVADQLNAGANFDDLAVLYDPNTGGELGWFPRGYLLEPDLEEAAFSLESGQYSGVIASEVGYHILLVVERDAQHPLSPDAYLVMQEKALGDWLVQKRTESEIVLAP